MGSKELYAGRIRALIEGETGATSGAAAEAYYERVHGHRFRETLAICKRHVPTPEARVLDVGRSPLTRLLAGHYKQVSTFGFPLETGVIDGIAHVPFDLTRAPRAEAWPDLGGRFDLIVYCETIEHMHVAPEFTLMLFAFLLSDAGRLVVTTPNAARLGNRLRLLAGKNPFERIRFFDENPGHFREYTRAELAGMGEAAGLICLEAKALDMYPRVWKSLIPPLGPLKDLADNLVAVYGKHP